MNRDQNVLRQIGLYYFEMTAQGVLSVRMMRRGPVSGGERGYAAARVGERGG